MNTQRLLGALLFSAALLLTGCRHESIQVEGSWARPAQAGANSAVYFVLSNNGDDDRLLGAHSAVAGQTQVHATIIDDQGQASMQHQESLDVPAGSVITFEPGGLHVMLMGLTTDLVAGETMPLTLIFENYGELSLEVPIQSN